MLSEVVDKYLELFPADREKLGLLIKQLADHQALDDRRNFSGHIAGDAIILSPDMKKILYIHHRHSGRWQQPGGHLDPDEEGPWSTAAREAAEETGVKLSQKIGPVRTDYNIPLHIVTGPINPSKVKKEPYHWHHDFRYGFIAEAEKLGPTQDKGIAAAKWVDLKDAMKMKDSGHELLVSIDRILSLI